MNQGALRSRRRTGQRASAAPRRERPADIQHRVNDILYRYDEHGAGPSVADRPVPPYTIDDTCKPTAFRRPVVVEHAHGVVDSGGVALSFWGVWFIVAAAMRFRRPLRRRQQHEREAAAKRQAQQLKDLTSRTLRAEDFGVFSDRVTAGREFLSATMRESTAALQQRRTRMVHSRANRIPDMTDVRTPKAAATPRSPKTTPAELRTTAKPQKAPAPPARKLATLQETARPGVAGSLAHAWRRPSHVASTARTSRPTLASFIPGLEPSSEAQHRVSTAHRLSGSTRSMSQSRDTDGLNRRESTMVAGPEENVRRERDPPAVLPQPGLVSGIVQSPPVATREVSQPFGVASATSAPFDSNSEASMSLFARATPQMNALAETPRAAAAGMPDSDDDDMQVAGRRRAFIPTVERKPFTNAEFTDCPVPEPVVSPFVAYPPPKEQRVVRRPIPPGASAAEARDTFDAFKRQVHHSTRRFHADELSRLEVFAERRKRAADMKRAFLTYHCENSEVTSAQDLQLALRVFVRERRIQTAVEEEVKQRLEWFYTFYHRITDVCASEQVSVLLGMLKPHFESLEDEPLVPATFREVVDGIDDETLAKQEVQFVLRHVAKAFAVNYVTFRELLERRHVMYVLQGSVGD